VSADHDRKFFDIFLIVLGGLVATTMGIYFVAQMTGGRAQAQYIQEDPAYIQLQEERISPAGQVAIVGEDNSDLPSSGIVQAATTSTAATTSPAPATASAPVEMSGKQVYEAACSACHAAGVAGAPKMGDAAEWAPRIAQGADTLNKHAVEGFQGNAGYMPPKGGRADLGDSSIHEAVSYMVDNSG
jgi:cytochrome c5